MIYHQVLDVETVTDAVELTLIKGLTLTKHKTVRIKIIPPWVWHASVGLDDSKEYKATVEWFKESGFLWEVHIDNEVFMVAHDVAMLLLSLVFMTKGGR